ncbi:hypothetical protein Taro_009485 [Colocasia esculenta]|uniref:Phosphatidylglycerophosphatase GEP4, mitochondrial n=1 Tax=Colocasia esculenta TaxID=4460 RepID=A0A843UA40_COLES|nr:hypothetical protein [Colocasia esculenta]
MSHHACVHHGCPLPSCSPPPLFVPLPLRSPPRRFLCFVPRINSRRRRSRSRSRSSCCGGDIATTTSRSSVLGDSRGARAEGSGMVMGGTSLRRWFEEVLGQRLNLAGIASFARVMATEEGRRLAIPHLWAPDIRWIDWRELERLGFRGIVFDKDNTITAPYSLSLWPPISASLAQCVSTFPGRVAVFSNSAGLYRYDPDGSKAKTLEDAIGGIHVIMHGKCTSLVNSC